MQEPIGSSSSQHLPYSKADDQPIPKPRYDKDHQTLDDIPSFAKKRFAIVGKKDAVAV